MLAKAEKSKEIKVEFVETKNSKDIDEDDEESYVEFKSELELSMNLFEWLIEDIHFLNKSFNDC